MGRRNRALKAPIAAPSASGGRAAWAAGAIGLAWAGLVAAVYFKKFPFRWLGVSDIADQLNVFRLSGAFAGFTALCLAVGVLFMAWALGHSLLRPWKIPWHSPLEETVYGWGLGQGVLAYLVLVLGAFQFYRPLVFWGLYFIGLAWAVFQWRSRDLRRLCLDAWAQIRARSETAPGDGWLRCLLWAAFGLNFLMCFVPEVFYDAMVYHLGVPRWFLLEGGIRYYTAIHAQFPFTRQMINLLGLALEGDTLAKMLHFATGLQIHWTFLSLADRWGRRRAGLVASLLFFSIPMVAMNLWTTGVDVAMAAVSLLALGAWMKSLMEPRSTRWTVLAGLFLGLTVSTKYPGGVDAALMGIVFAVYRLWTTRDLRATVRDLAVMTGVALLVFLPWLVKNGVLTGNPVYPYLSSLLGGKDLLPEKLALFNSDIANGAARDPLAFVTAPWRLTFNLLGSASSPGLFPLGLIGAMVWGAMRRDGRPAFARPLTAFVVLYFAVMFILTNQTRYAISGLAAHAFLMGEAVDSLGRAAGKVIRWGLFMGIALLAVAGLDMSFLTATRTYAPWGVLSGEESRKEYQYYTHLYLNPGPATEGYDYLKEKWTGEGRVLILGDEKVSTCQVPFVANGVFNEQWITRWAREAGSPEKLWEILTAREKITHWLLNGSANMRLTSYNPYRWDPVTLGILCEFWDRHVRLAHRVARKERYDPRVINETLIYVLTPAGGPPGDSAPFNALLLLEEERVGPYGSAGWREKRLALLDAIVAARGPIASIENRRRALLASPAN